MTWNYRIIRTVKDGVESFDIHEVYYEADGQPFLWSVEPIAPTGDTLEELIEDMRHMALALNKPVLREQTATTLVEYEEGEE